jgi:hypothetical protein
VAGIVFTVFLVLANIPAGNYSLSAKATDNAGASTTSSAVNIQVKNKTEPTPATLPSLSSRQVKYQYNNTTRRWDRQTTSTAWNTQRCDQLTLKGISDYNDGISRQALQKYVSEGNTAPNLASNYRNCIKQNIQAKNIQCSDFAQVFSPKSNNDSSSFLVAKNCLTTTLNQTAVPVYTYQFEYKYDFPADQKARLSNLYRPLTGIQGEYSGVVWTYTFYSYLDVATNRMTPWSNPEIDNANKGWLVYGVE